MAGAGGTRARRETALGLAAQGAGPQAITAATGYSLRHARQILAEFRDPAKRKRSASGREAQREAALAAARGGADAGEIAKWFGYSARHAYELVKIAALSGGGHEAPALEEEQARGACDEHLGDLQREYGEVSPFEMAMRPSGRLQRFVAHGDSEAFFPTLAAEGRAC